MEKKINKTKLVMIIIIALVVIAAITLGIIFIGGKEDVDDTFAKAGSISKTESEFEELTVKGIELKYVEERNETILNFSIENKTDEKVQKKTIKIQLLNENDQLISGLETTVSTIDPKGSHPVNITLAGNIQGIKKIKLVNPEGTSEEVTDDAQA